MRLLTVPLCYHHHRPLTHMQALCWQDSACLFFAFVSVLFLLLLPPCLEPHLAYNGHPTNIWRYWRKVGTPGAPHHLRSPRTQRDGNEPSCTTQHCSGGRAGVGRAGAVTGPPRCPRPTAPGATRLLALQELQSLRSTLVGLTPSLQALLSPTPACLTSRHQLPLQMCWRETQQGGMEGLTKVNAALSYLSALLFLFFSTQVQNLGYDSAWESPEN